MLRREIVEGAIHFEPRKGGNSVRPMIKDFPEIFRLRPLRVDGGTGRNQREEDIRRIIFNDLLFDLPRTDSHIAEGGQRNLMTEQTGETGEESNGERTRDAMGYLETSSLR